MSDNILHLPTKKPPSAPLPPVDPSAYARELVHEAVTQLEAVARNMRIFQGLFPPHDRCRCNVAIFDLEALATIIRDSLIEAACTYAEVQVEKSEAAPYLNLEAVHTALELVCVIVHALQKGSLPPGNSIVAGPAPGTMRVAEEKVQVALKAIRRLQRRI